MTDAAALPFPRWLATRRKILAVLFVAALVLAYVHRPSKQEFLSHQTRWKTAVNDAPCLCAGIYFASLVALIGANVPVATGWMILGGFLFGRLQGAMLVGIGAPAGALLGMLTSRYLLATALRRAAERRKRWRRKLAKIDRGFEREGWFYLLILRLTPIIPFFMVNAGMGLTRIRLFTFWWVTMAGMIPAMLVFVNVGASAGEVRSAADLISTKTVLALTLLTLFPLFARALRSKVLVG